MRHIDPLPPELSRLFPRQRELVSLIYECGGATLHEIRARIPDAPSPRGFRTLLDRLERKGLVKRRRSGRHSEILYLPVLITETAQLRAFDRLTKEHFGGSPAGALKALSRLASQEKA